MILKVFQEEDGHLRRLLATRNNSLQPKPKVQILSIKLEFHRFAHLLPVAPRQARPESEKDGASKQKRFSKLELPKALLSGAASNSKLN